MPITSTIRSGSRAILVAGLLVLAAVGMTSAAQQEGQPSEPRLNQPGKDVQWVPTPAALAEKMLDLAGVTASDTVVDLGSGDGVLVIAAAKRGARARGIEYDAGLVALSKRNARAAGVERLAAFEQGDIFKSRFTNATVITTFLLPSMNLRLRPTFLSMKPGTRIVSNTFQIGEWEPDETATVDPCERWCRAMLWIVPARVGGVWRTPKGELRLNQKFQVLTGALGDDPIEGGRVRGNAVTFTAAGVTYEGAVDGYRLRMRAVVDGRTVEWTAQPLPRP